VLFIDTIPKSRRHWIWAFMLMAMTHSVRHATGRCNVHV